jgi:predicted esterase
MNEPLTYIHRYEPGQGENKDTTLLLLHGTGGDENALSGLGNMLLPGAAQLSPRGNVSENGMARFFRRFAEGVLDVEDLQRRTGDLAEFIHQASLRYGFDEQRVIAVGFSNGANIAGSLLFMRPPVLQAALLLHAMVPFVPDPLPDLRGKPIFLGAGRLDPLVSATETEQLTDLFRRSGANVELSWQNDGHTVTLEEAKAAKAWLEGLLKS